MQPICAERHQGVPVVCCEPFGHEGLHHGIIGPCDVEIMWVKDDETVWTVNGGHVYWTPTPKREQ